MLFIDDNQREVRIRKKQRRARADDNPRLTARYRLPVHAARGRRDFRIPQDGLKAETFFKPR